MREFRTVDASKMLKAIAEDNDLSKTMLQHIKSALSGVFTHAKNEGASDGVNPVQDVRIPRSAREPGETHAYNLPQIRGILEPCRYYPKQWSLRRPLPDSEGANCVGSNGWITHANLSPLGGPFGRPLLMDRRRERAQKPYRSFVSWQRF